MNQNYFHRVTQLTPTRFWINNVTTTEAHLALEEGATGCTQNPSYVWKMIDNNETKEKVDRLIQSYKKEGFDIDTTLVHIQRDLVGEIAEIFLPQYESSHHQNGYVSIQGNPFKEDTESIIENALFNYEISPNIMVKIPATKEGLEAISYIAAKGIAINATEVMSIKQAVDVCEAYEKATKGIKNKAPIYYSHITGILDEYFTSIVEQQQIQINRDALFQAGMLAARKCYHITKSINKEVGFIGGGARGLHHFTEMVGADACITINWKNTADILLEQNPYVIERFWMKPSDLLIDELCAKLPDFKKAYFLHEIHEDEYEEFGPVVLFRKSFEDAWLKAQNYLKNF